MGEDGARDGKSAKRLRIRAAQRIQYPSADPAIWLVELCCRRHGAIRRNERAGGAMGRRAGDSAEVQQRGKRGVYIEAGKGADFQAQGADGPAPVWSAVFAYGPGLCAGE